MGKKKDSGTFTIQEYFKAQRKHLKKQERIEWCKEHTFDLLNFIIAVFALIRTFYD